MQVLINGITVGDIASWMDSLLFAGLLRYGAGAFAAVESSSEDKQMAYTFVVGWVVGEVGGVGCWGGLGGGLGLCGLVVGLVGWGGLGGCMGRVRWGGLSWWGGLLGWVRWWVGFVWVSCWVGGVGWIRWVHGAGEVGWVKLVGWGAGVWRWVAVLYM